MLENFLNNYVYISNNSFKQDKSIANKLRNEVFQNIKNINSITTIGGEAYLYGLINDEIMNINNYTNSKFIYNDVNLNNKRFNKILINELIDYNTFTKYRNSDLLILNLAKLNIKLLEEINKRFYKKIIIINCHHNEFWKRINLLHNYKLQTRKYFIVSKKHYFITVNILEYIKEIPEFIPLGLTCTIAYQLEKLGLRRYAYPFDWCKLSLDKLIIALDDIINKNEINKFINLKIKKFSNKHENIIFKNTGSYILSNGYGIEFAHELLNTNNLITLSKKINKRVERFKDIINNKNIKKVFLLFLKTKKNKDNNKLIERIKNILKIETLKVIEIFEYNNKFIINDKILDYKDWKYSNINWNNIILENILS